MSHLAWLCSTMLLTTTLSMPSDPGFLMRSDLTMLQAAIEAYRGQHFFHYPSAKSPGELIAILKHEDDLPSTFQPSGSFSEFQLNNDGYQISLSTASQTVRIVSPERFNPFWSFLW